MKKENGITLIALVITIIVLLILSGVTITMIVGQNGILSQANTAKEETIIATEKEQIEIALVTYEMYNREKDKYDLIEEETGQKILNIEEEYVLKGEIIEFESGRKYLITENKVEYMRDLENAIIIAGGTSNSSYLQGSTTYLRKDVELIELVNNKIISKNAIDSWDISQNKDGSVVAWITDDDNNNLYEWHIGANYRIKANAEMTWYFRGFTNLKNIIGLEYMDFYQTTSVSSMFGNDINLKSIDIDFSNAKNLTAIGAIFSGCRSLESVNLNSLDNTKITSLKEVFMSCEKLEYIDFSNWNIGNITNMNFLFYGCSNLKQINMSNFTVDGSLESTFYGCNINVKVLVKDEETKNKLLQSGYIADGNIEIVEKN